MPAKKKKSAPKKALGKGLGNLLESDSQSAPAGATDENTTVEIKTDLIRTNPDNPRKKFNQSSIDELATTIREHGLLQPIIVRKEEDHYVVISGERRLRACRLLKLDTVSCIIKELEPEQILEVSLIENIQREQLDAIEEARVYRTLLDKYKLTQDVLSQKVGRNRATIANRMRLLQLPESVQALVADQRLTEGQVRPLLTLKNEKLLLKIVREITADSLSARQVEDLVKAQKKKPATGNKKKEKVSPEITDLQGRLEEALQTRVVIRHNNTANKGKITLDYFDLDDLQRILKLLGIK